MRTPEVLGHALGISQRAALQALDDFIVSGEQRLDAIQLGRELRARLAPATSWEGA